MPTLGRASSRRRDECESDLISVLNEAIKHYDFSVIWGHRDHLDQTSAFENGHSQLRWPKSMHNKIPSRAFDVVPWPLGFKATDAEFYVLATHILRAASKVGVRLVWGGHWRTLRDLAHFELEKEM
jgi:peptidoglycan L-alanyl-D-glutamate endopeptidase CwlK